MIAYCERTSARSLDSAVVERAIDAAHERAQARAFEDALGGRMTDAESEIVALLEAEGINDEASLDELMAGSEDEEILDPEIAARILRGLSADARDALLRGQVASTTVVQTYIGVFGAWDSRMRRPGPCRSERRGRPVTGSHGRERRPSHSRRRTATASRSAGGGSSGDDGPAEPPASDERRARRPHRVLPIDDHDHLDHLHQHDDPDGTRRAVYSFACSRCIECGEVLALVAGILICANRSCRSWDGFS